MCRSVLLTLLAFSMSSRVDAAVLTFDDLVGHPRGWGNVDCESVPKSDLSQSLLLQMRWFLTANSGLSGAF